MSSKPWRHCKAAPSELADAIRNLSHQLHPGVLPHTGLISTLRRHCVDLERHHRLKVSFIAQDELGELNPDVALCLFRVAQEALTNATRHARARTILVQLAAIDGGVELRIDDDGVGFVVGDRARIGLGLRSIDERVRLVGGTVQLESRPGHGTSLLVRVPLSTARRRLTLIPKSGIIMPRLGVRPVPVDRVERAWRMHCSPRHSNASCVCCSASPSGASTPNGAHPARRHRLRSGPARAGQAGGQRPEIVARRVGRQKRYQANAASPLFSELRNIVLKTVRPR